MLVQGLAQSKWRMVHKITNDNDHNNSYINYTPYVLPLVLTSTSRIHCIACWYYMDFLVLEYTMPHHLRGRGWKYKKLEVEEPEI